MAATPTFTPYTFTSAQLVDIRRFCGYPAYGDGSVVFPAPWIQVNYLALEYRMQNMTTDEGNVVVNTYLTNLYPLETGIFGAAANLDTDEAGPWKHNRNEVQDRTVLFDMWRRRLCDFMGVPPGPHLGDGSCRIIM